LLRNKNIKDFETLIGYFYVLLSGGKKMIMRRIISICAAVLIVSSSLISIGFIKEARAIPADPIIDPNPLNMSYIWEKTKNLSDIIYEYPEGLIPKGRAFGSWGGGKAADLLEGIMNELSLEVSNETIEPIDESTKQYNKIINVTDFQLEIYNSNGLYPFSSIVPVNESFVFPIGRPESELSKDHNFTNLSLKHVKLTGKILEIISDLLFFESKVITENCFINKYIDFLGEFHYLNETSENPSPEQQSGNIYLLDETEHINSRLENLSWSAGIVIIDNSTAEETMVNKTAFPFVANLSFSSGLQLKTLADETDDLIAYMESGVLTVLYNITSKPENDYVLIDKIPDYIGIREFYNNTYVQFYRNRKLLRTIPGLDLFPDEKFVGYMIGSA
jgi:hypothetical protein